MASKTEVGLHGSDDFVQTEAASYKSPKEYSAQGNERVIRDLLFSYLVSTKDAVGNETLVARSANRGDTVRVDQIGMIALRQGEENHSFYTADELDNLESSGRETPAPDAHTDTSSLSEVELAEWLKTGNDGSSFTMDEVLEAVGNDKDLAHRMLAAENMATDGDPRKGLVDGLTRVIEQG